MRNYIKKNKKIKRNKSSEVFSSQNTFNNINNNNINNVNNTMGQGLQRYFVVNGKSKMLPKHLKPEKIKKFKRFSKAKKEELSFKEKCKIKRKEWKQQLVNKKIAKSKLKPANVKKAIKKEIKKFGKLSNLLEQQDKQKFQLKGQSKRRCVTQ